MTATNYAGLKQFFFGMKDRNLASLVMSNGQISQENLPKIVCIEDSEQFMDAKFKFDPQYYIRKGSPEVGEPSKVAESIAARTSSIQTLKEQLDTMGEEVEARQVPESPQLAAYQAKIQVSRLSSEFRPQDHWKGPAKEVKAGVEDQKQYLAEFLKQLLIRYQMIQSDEAEKFSKKIIQHGSLMVLKQSINIPDEAFNRLQKIIKSCQTYQAFIKFGGKDQRSLKQMMIAKLFKTLNFGPTVSREVFCELLKHPTSNVVASSQLLTNAQKRDYYESDFYKSGFLIEYTKTQEYENSREGMAKKQRDELMYLIIENARLTTEVINSVLSYDLEGFLRHEMLRHIKETIYNAVKTTMPNYHFMCRLKKAGLPLKEESIVDLKFALKNVFLEIGLEFESWSSTEEQILKREYHWIDGLGLSLAKKYRLREFVIDEVEEHFTRSQYCLNYRQRVQEVVLDTIMSDPISRRYSFDQLLLFTEQILDDQKYLEGRGAAQFIPADKERLIPKMNALQSLQQFRKNSELDITEKCLKEKKALKKIILKNNLEDKIEVSTSAIDQFIEAYFKNNGKLANGYPHVICDLRKLQDSQKLEPFFEGSFIGHHEENVLEESCVDMMKDIGQGQSPSMYIKSISIEEPQKPAVDRSEDQLKQLFEQFESSYFKEIPDSKLEKVLSQNYSDNHGELLKLILKYDPYKQRESDDFESSLKSMAKRRLLEELRSPPAFKIVEPLVKRYKALNMA